MPSTRGAKRWLRNVANGFAGRDRHRHPQTLHTAAREIIGPTGNLFSNGWREFERGHAAYLRSFQPRVPPSLHISHRDATRANRPIPLVERCLEDLGDRKP